MPKFRISRCSFIFFCFYSAWGNVCSFLALQKMSILGKSPCQREPKRTFPSEHVQISRSNFKKITSIQLNTDSQLFFPLHKLRLVCLYLTRNKYILLWLKRGFPTKYEWGDPPPSHSAQLPKSNFWLEIWIAKIASNMVNMYSVACFRTQCFLAPLEMV